MGRRGIHETAAENLIAFMGRRRRTESSEPYARVAQRPNRAVFATAQSFHRAAEILHDETKDGVPMIVNGVFALEVYLKSLTAELHFVDPKEIEPGVRVFGRVYDHVETWGHDLSVIFDELPAEISEYLSRRFEEREIVRGRSLRDCLETFDGVFVKWRYPFEGIQGGAVELSLLYDLLAFIEEAAKSLPSAPA